MFSKYMTQSDPHSFVQLIFITGLRVDLSVSPKLVSLVANTAHVPASSAISLSELTWHIKLLI